MLVDRRSTFASKVLLPGKLLAVCHTCTPGRTFSAILEGCSFSANFILTHTPVKEAKEKQQRQDNKI
jgi:hypothetical protein